MEIQSQSGDDLDALNTRETIATYDTEALETAFLLTDIEISGNRVQALLIGDLLKEYVSSQLVLIIWVR